LFFHNPLDLGSITSGPQEKQTLIKNSGGFVFLGILLTEATNS